VLYFKKYPLIFNNLRVEKVSEPESRFQVKCKNHIYNSLEHLHPKAWLEVAIVMVHKCG